MHLFTRDPSRYLLGVYGSYHTWESIDIWRAAAEFQLYVQRFSLDGLAGYEGINFPSTTGGLTVLNSDDNHFFTHIDFAYYPIDDLRLYAGYRYESEASLGAAGFEYLLRDYGSPMSLFVKSDFGKEEFNRITGGLRIYSRAQPRQDADRAPPHRGPGELHARLPERPDAVGRAPVHAQPR